MRADVAAVAAGDASGWRATACGEAAFGPSELDALEKAQAAFESAGGFAVEGRVSKVLKGLGFAEAEFDRPCSSFSGGWQMRIGLARLLLSDPSLLVLDEPTNHLDASARRWLGEYVGAYDGTVLVVSHDEPFIAAAADSIAEVVGGRLELYKSTRHAKFLSEPMETVESRYKLLSASMAKSGKVDDWMKARITILKLLKSTRAHEAEETKEEL